MPSLSPLWKHPPENRPERLARALDRPPASRDLAACRVFFRADDVGIPSRSFSRLMEIFSRRRVPLCLAVVPAWITPGRWKALRAEAGGGAENWCWHQHGFRHGNHQKTGKKAEFGSGREPDAIRRDLSRGRMRLESILGEEFFQAFTPPWNRVSGEALDALAELGFPVISRSRDSKPPAPEGLLEFPVCVDLHTRKENDPLESWNALFNELSLGLQSPLCGIMIHHQRANGAAFSFLDRLAGMLARHPGVELTHFRTLARDAEL